MSWAIRQIADVRASPTGLAGREDGLEMAPPHRRALTRPEATGLGSVEDVLDAHFQGKACQTRMKLQRVPKALGSENGNLKWSERGNPIIKQLSADVALFAA